MRKLVKAHARRISLGNQGFITATIRAVLLERVFHRIDSGDVVDMM